MFLSIKYKLIILFLVTSVVPIFLLGGFTYVETYKAVGQSEQRRMEEQVQNITNSMNIALEDAEAQTKNMATTPAFGELLNITRPGKLSRTPQKKLKLPCAKFM